MTLRERSLVLLVLLFLGIHAGNASPLSQQYTASWTAPDFFPLGTSQIYVRDVRNETDHEASFDISNYVGEQIRLRLAAAGFQGRSADNSQAIVVDVSIHLYQEGGTLGRWLGGGGGAAYVVVRAAFRKGGKAIGAELMTVSAIAAGGLFSAGAEKTVLEDVADVFVAFLERRGEK